MLRLITRFSVRLIAHFLLTLDELRIEMISTNVTWNQLSSSCNFFHKDEVSSNILGFLVIFDTDAHFFFVDPHRSHAGENGFVGL